jgi:hypothetical protein
MAGSPGMVPTFIADRSTGAAPSFAPAASPRVRRRPSSWPPRRPRNSDAGVAHPTGRTCTAPRPTSARLEPMPRLRGFSHWFAFTTPSRLACRTQAVWQCRPVPSSSGLLPPVSRASRTGLPPASATRCDGPPLDLSFHSVNRRLVAHFALAAQPGKSQGRPLSSSGSNTHRPATGLPSLRSPRRPLVPVGRTYGGRRTSGQPSAGSFMPRDTVVRSGRATDARLPGQQRSCPPICVSTSKRGALS